jgi:patatin-related protein
VNKETQTVESNPAESDEPVPFDPDNEVREVRFAVVMYGGVSLAIYINGVAQELLNMVRATAPNTADDDKADKALLADVKLTGSLAVYRKLGQFLLQRSKLAEAAEPDAQGNPKPPSREAIRTRFVVDVISGTSAGGINGIFLAKALARNQGMEGLKRLWLTEGDLGKLLNDKFSIADLSGLELKEPQASLLNSQRMYRKLLEALDQMDEQRNPSAETTDSPLVNELDLFITTTDIEGIPLPITLSDSVVYERRYKNVFHFRYATKPATGSKRDDFVKANDPFLAFAARCTSSFPFAFEAMCLSDIRAVTSGYPQYEDTPPMPPKWDSFFSEYVRPGLIDLDKHARGSIPTGVLPSDAIEGLRSAFYTRAFGDGGYLDNKPFSHATAMLMRRRFEAAVTRKLLYVEPSPEHPELDPKTERKRPDFAQNIRAAVVDLPRKETIREDIERLQERNAMLRRMAAFTKHVDEDMACIPEDEKKAKLRDDLKDNFATEDLRTMIDLYGVSYGAYHRLKVEEVTVLLADLIARAAGYDPASDAAIAIQELVEAWRDKNYVAFKPREEGSAERRDTQNAFLKKFDIRFVLRRLNFLRLRVTQLAFLDDDALHLLKAWLDHDAEAPALDLANRPKDWDDDFRRELSLIRGELAPQVTNVRSAQEKLLNPQSNTGEPLYQAMPKLDTGWPQLQSILQCDSPAARRQKADELLDESNESGRKREEALRDLSEVICRGFADQSVTDQPLNAGEGHAANNSAGAKAARACLDYCKKNFYYYDLVTYPVQYGTGAGEANEVDVFRVSPEDATALMDERGSGRSKLAGTALMSFGAFLDEGWRRNDMLWGRLDGAERIISALLPDESDDTTRKNLIKQAHMAILDEEIKSGDIRTICDLVGSTLAGRAPLSEAQQTLRTFVQQKIKSQDLTEPLQAALYRCLDQPQKIWEYYGSPEFQVNRKLDAEIALRLISRATNVTGRMLEALAEDYRFGKAKQVGTWIARLASIFWNIIGVAVPGSLRNLVLRYWLGLIYVFEFFLIFFGILFAKADIKVFGWQALGLTVAFNLGVTMLGYYMSDKRRKLNVIRAALAAVLVVLVVFGAVHVVDKYFTDLSWPRQFALAAVVALPLWIVVGWVAWRKWIGQFWSRLRRKLKGASNDSAAPPPVLEPPPGPAAKSGGSPV